MRRAKPEDRAKVIEVESKSTPNLSYVPEVWDMFVSDMKGEFSVAEVEGEIVACGKYTIVPDGSVWLETLRVIPERQGKGIGKRFYEHWLKKAQDQNVKTLRMYTGLGNVRSKGLAERYGLSLAATYQGAKMQCNSTYRDNFSFRHVTDPDKAVSLLMPPEGGWGKFHSLNRTFFEITPELCRHIALNGMVYEDEEGNVITLGTRFMPEKALHIGLFKGDSKACLDFAMNLCIERGAGQLSCDYPAHYTEIQKELTDYGFTLDRSNVIVMEINT